MKLIDVDEMSLGAEVIDDDVFVDSDDAELSSAGSATSSDDEAETSSTVIRCDTLCRVRLGRLLGSGGFGRVYDSELEGAGRRRRVAVKVPRRYSSSSGRETATDCFDAESTVVHLRHPNVVSVLATGWTREQLDDCSWSIKARCDDEAVDMIPVVVMEFAGCRNLQSAIDDSSQTLSLRRRLK